MTAYFLDSELPTGLKGIFERSGVSLSIADYEAEDCPLIGVNQAFCDTSGYAPEEVLGRNCRFLQPNNDAGPVRERMRHFLADPDTTDERFIVPNVTRDGRPFLNLVYLAKLAQSGTVRLVLGAQFAIDPGKTRDPDLYDRALAEDLRQLNLLTRDDSWAVLGSVEALASSQALLARALLD
ncbi:PAS domain-containing protein [Qipengyuania sp. 6B39]|uniref:PAS domain-containing protein n=1 Tax=Qipengyuania proteolytica TaxID=2867239 RepID=UPI001C8AFDD8|nr:PAS domain-containing protein [Qipengyuania proteolytica]MBX7496601.1 PAS domain-containing protein [Qipengyuania proteolytica]